jgi:hypothetical protein
MTKIVEAEEFRLIDSSGRLRARLGLDDSSVSLSLHTAQGTLQVRLHTDDQGCSALQIHDAAGGSPRMDISVDARGCHVLLASPAKQQSYFFLKNTGATGLVLTDAVGARRAQFMLSPEGRADVSFWGTTGTAGEGSGSKQP